MSSTSDTSGLFMYAARPAQVEDGKYSNQRYFGTTPEVNRNHCLDIEGSRSKASVTMLRFADQSIGLLEIRVGGGFGANAELNVYLTADQLQILACAALDAAHDLRTVPSTKEEQVAA